MANFHYIGSYVMRLLRMKPSRQTSAEGLEDAGDEAPAKDDGATCRLSPVTPPTESDGGLWSDTDDDGGDGDDVAGEEEEDGEETEKEEEGDHEEEMNIGEDDDVFEAADDDPVEVGGSLVYVR